MSSSRLFGMLEPSFFHECSELTLRMLWRELSQTHAAEVRRALSAANLQDIPAWDGPTAAVREALQACHSFVSFHNDARMARAVVSSPPKVPVAHGASGVEDRLSGSMVPQTNREFSVSKTAAPPSGKADRGPLARDRSRRTSTSHSHPVMVSRSVTPRTSLRNQSENSLFRAISPTGAARGDVTARDVGSPSFAPAARPDRSTAVAPSNGADPSAATARTGLEPGGDAGSPYAPDSRWRPRRALASAPPWDDTERSSLSAAADDDEPHAAPSADSVHALVLQHRARSSVLPLELVEDLHHVLGDALSVRCGVQPLDGTRDDDFWRSAVRAVAKPASLHGLIPVQRATEERALYDQQALLLEVLAMLDVEALLRSDHQYFAPGDLCSQEHVADQIAEAARGLLRRSVASLQLRRNVLTRPVDEHELLLSGAGLNTDEEWVARVEQVQKIRKVVAVPTGRGMHTRESTAASSSPSTPARSKAVGGGGKRTKGGQGRGKGGGTPKRGGKGGGPSPNKSRQ